MSPRGSGWYPQLYQYGRYWKRLVLILAVVVKGCVWIRVINSYRDENLFVAGLKFTESWQQTLLKLNTHVSQFSGLKQIFPNDGGNRWNLFNSFSSQHFSRNFRLKEFGINLGHGGCGLRLIVLINLPQLKNPGSISKARAGPPPPHGISWRLGLLGDFALIEATTDRQTRSKGWHRDTLAHNLTL